MNWTEYYERTGRHAKTCKECGQEFKYSNKTKQDMCHKCRLELNKEKQKLIKEKAQKYDKLQEQIRELKEEAEEVYKILEEEYKEYYERIGQYPLSVQKDLSELKGTIEVCKKILEGR